MPRNCELHRVSVLYTYYRISPPFTPSGRLPQPLRAKLVNIGFEPHTFQKLSLTVVIKIFSPQRV